MIAIDCHVHCSTHEWLEGSIGPMLEGTQEFFRTEGRVRTAEEMAAEYAEWDLFGVLLAVFTQAFRRRSGGALFRLRG